MVQLKMSPTKNLLLCLTAFALMGIGVSVAAIWFLWLMPKIARQDPLWEERFSAKTMWTQAQKGIRRYGWEHDDFFYVGRYGDKEWAEWIMAQAESGKEIATCGVVGHKDAALKFITCHDPAPGTNYNTEAQWIGWWKTNKGKSQLEWIQSGLRQFGVVAHLPSISQDAEPLLTLLGNKRTNVTEKIPAHVKYNAFRWLRDSEFDVIAYAISNVTVHTPEMVRVGVIEYSKFEKLFPKRDQIGVLPLKPLSVDQEAGYKIAFYDLEVQLSGYAAMLAPMILGCVLLRQAKTTQEPGRQSR